MTWFKMTKWNDIPLCFTFSGHSGDAENGDDIFLQGVAGGSDDVVASVHDKRHLVTNKLGSG